MENIYQKYYLSDQITTEMIKDAIVVFDTSALLDLYYYSETTLSVIFHNVFTYLDKRLWIPAQVYYEFLKNKDKVALKPAHSYKILIEKPKSGADGGHVSNIIKITSDLDKSLIVELKNQLKTLKEKTKVADKHPYIEQVAFDNIDIEIANFENQIKDFQEKVDVFTEEITKKINEKISAINSNADDMISKMVSEKFAVGDEFTYSQMTYIAKEGEFRYKEEIPPGYEDSKSKNGLQKYGDLFAWKQILIYAKKKKKDVLLITNDVKEDWFDLETQAPRFELLKEFNSETGRKIWTLNMKTFLYKMNSILDTNEESLEAAIEEVNVIQNEKDKNIETANSRYYKMLLENLWCIDIDENNDVLQEVQSNGEWRVDGRPHIFELVKKREKIK